MKLEIIGKKRKEEEKVFFDENEKPVEKNIGFDDEDGDSPVEMKQRNFEFLNNVMLMRFLRSYLFVQALALALHSQDRSVRLPPFFEAVWSYFLTYTLHFYSRPFVDFVYLCQKNVPKVVSFALNIIGIYGSPHINTKAPNLPVGRRVLGMEELIPSQE